MTENVIETRGLTKHYGDFSALEDLDLDVQRGEIFGFLGPNGAGKSTTMRTLLDQIRPTRGSARILGLDIGEDSVEIRRHLGYLPGDLALYPKLTGHQTLDYFANLRGDVDRSYVAELAERLKADLSKKVGEYSTGNRQKIGLIQAFMHKPELLILDEPNAGLDPLIQQEFHRLMEEVRAEGRTVFLSSHTLSEVERVADRVGIIRSGHLVGARAGRRAQAQGDPTHRLRVRRRLCRTTSSRGVAGVRAADVHDRMAAGVLRGFGQRPAPCRDEARGAQPAQQGVGPRGDLPGLLPRRSGHHPAELGAEREGGRRCPLRC